MQVYLQRDGVEFEITVVTIEEGVGTWDYWSDTGYTFEVDRNPTFQVVSVADDDGNEITLTDEETAWAKEKAVDRYWETYDDNN